MVFSCGSLAIYLQTWGHANAQPFKPSRTKRGRGADPCRRLLAKQRLDDVLAQGADLRSTKALELRALVVSPSEHRFHGTSPKGTPPGEDEVEHAASTEAVDVRAIWLEPQEFRCRVPWRPAAPLHPKRVVQERGASEVTQHATPRGRHEDILRLDAAVYNVAGVDVNQRRQDSCHPFFGHVLCHFAEVRHVVGNVAARAVLKRECPPKHWRAAQRRRPENAMHAADVRVPLRQPEQGHFRQGLDRLQLVLRAERLQNDLTKATLFLQEARTSAVHNGVAPATERTRLDSIVGAQVVADGPHFAQHGEKMANRGGPTVHCHQPRDSYASQGHGRRENHQEVGSAPIGRPVEASHLSPRQRNFRDLATVRSVGAEVGALDRECAPPARLPLQIALPDDERRFQLARWHWRDIALDAMESVEVHARGLRLHGLHIGHVRHA
mmetsp:Transcript_21992/g.61523  ORF Transcript_21992/g.61523 Transcript_21992/m.61523 type:complete len:439 (-) Transcript_21992:105-1421(-)